MQQLFSLMSLKYVCCYWFLVWICKVKAFLTGIKCWVGRVCYFLEWKFSSYVTELVRRLLKARTKVLDSHDNQVLRVDSKLLNYFRPFQFDESRRNRVSGIKTQSRIGRYKSRTGSTRTASPGRINSDRLGPTRIK